MIDYEKMVIDATKRIQQQLDEANKSTQILANALKEAAENHSLNYGKYKELAEKYLND